MGMAFGITIVIILLSLSGYIVFLIRQHRELEEIRRSIPFGGESLNGRAIIDVPTYRETKDEMSRLRSSLDRALDIYGRLSADFSGDSSDAGNDADGRGPERIRELTGAIFDLRGAAEALLAAVEHRPPQSEQEKENHFTQSGGDSTEALSIPGSQHFQMIGASLTLVGPSIAGCYYAMTEADEDDIIEQVASQVRQIIDAIDSALRVLHAPDPALALRAEEL